MKLHLGDCTLYSFNPDLEEHLEYQEELLQDKSVTKYLKNLKSQLKQQKRDMAIFNRAYLVQIKDEFIGYVYIFEPQENEVDLHYAVDRYHRGYHYGATILRETSGYLLTSFQEIDRIRLVIAKNNLPSHRSACEAGFEFDNSYTYYKEGKAK